MQLSQDNGTHRQDMELGPCSLQSPLPPFLEVIMEDFLKLDSHNRARDSSGRAFCVCFILSSLPSLPC